MNFRVLEGTGEEEKLVVSAETREKVTVLGRRMAIT